LQSDRISQQPNLGFDISMTDIFGALCNGASLIPIVKKSDSLSLGDFIKREKITRWNSTPSAIGMMISSGQLKYENISTIKVFVFCGEPLMYEYVEAIFKILPDALIYNTYGPTEATVAVTSLLLTNHNYKNYSMDGAIAIGPPICGNDIIIDVKANEEQDSEGELYISGLQLARGYFNDQDKTQSVFLRKYFHDRGEIFCYKTGDYVKKVAGNIYFKERIDFQVKIKGHRIELDEVSSAIRKLGWPLVLSFVIDDRIISIVENVIDKNFNEVNIRKSLREHLDSYATPSRVYCVDRIPRNDNDKLDRKAAMNLVLSTQRGISNE
jgi:D-alanine--poly(phosphoribitol) ligase subunit 1